MATAILQADVARPTRIASPASADGQTIYAIGDIHGRYDLLKDLLGRIWSDWIVRADGRHPILVFCGDYVDRGPDSAAVIEALIWLRDRGDFAVSLLKGNHEQAMLDFIEDPAIGTAWLEHGGDATLRSYGVALPDPALGDVGLREARAELLEHMPASHFLLLKELRLMVTVGDYAFVHAGIRADIPLERQKAEDLLWIRNGFIDTNCRFEKIIVHGHSWVSDRVDMAGGRIGIDTGAYETGVLSAVRIEDDGVEILQTKAGMPQQDLFRK